MSKVSSAFLWIFGISCSVWTATFAATALQSAQFYRLRKGHDVPRIHSRLGFRQIILVICYELYVGSQYIISITGTTISSNSAWNLIVNYCLWESLSFGIFWSWFIRCWHLWYDNNCIVARITCKWYKIIQNSPQSQSTSKILILKRLFCCCHKCDTNSIPSMKELDSFIHYEPTLGNPHVTIKILYLMIVVITAAFSVVFYYFDKGTGISKLYTLCLCYVIFFLCPLIILLFLSYDVNVRLAFVDHYFVGQELKYQCKLIIINQINFLMIEYLKHGNWHPSIFEDFEATLLLILYLISMLFYYGQVFVMTNWVLSKTGHHLCQVQKNKHDNTEASTSKSTSKSYSCSKSKSKSKSKSPDPYPIVKSSNVTIGVVLSNTPTFALFMNYLSKQFCSECLLSLVEFIQYQNYVFDYITTNIEYFSDYIQSNEKIMDYLNASDSYGGRSYHKTIRRGKSYGSTMRSHRRIASVYLTPDIIDMDNSYPSIIYQGSPEPPPEPLPNSYHPGKENGCFTPSSPSSKDGVQAQSLAQERNRQTSFGVLRQISADIDETGGEFITTGGIHIEPDHGEHVCDDPDLPESSPDTQIGIPNIHYIATSPPSARNNAGASTNTATALAIDKIAINAISPTITSNHNFNEGKETIEMIRMASGETIATPNNTKNLKDSPKTPQCENIDTQDNDMELGQDDHDNLKYVEIGSGANSVEMIASICQYGQLKETEQCDDEYDDQRDDEQTQPIKMITLENISSVKSDPGPRRVYLHHNKNNIIREESEIINPSIQLQLNHVTSNSAGTNEPSHELSHQQLSNDEILNKFDKKLIRTRYSINFNNCENFPQSSIVFENTQDLPIVYGIKQPDVKQLKQKCYSLYQKYIAVSSEYEVNISSKSRNYYATKMKNFDAFENDESITPIELLIIFEPCMDEMLRLLRSKFRSFKRKESFQSFSKRVLSD